MAGGLLDGLPILQGQIDHDTQTVQELTYRVNVATVVDAAMLQHFRGHILRIVTIESLQVGHAQVVGTVRNQQWDKVAFAGKNRIGRIADVADALRVQQPCHADQPLKYGLEEVLPGHNGRRISQYLGKRHVLTRLDDVQPDNVVMLHRRGKVQLVIVGNRGVILALTLDGTTESDVID